MPARRWNIRAVFAGRQRTVRISGEAMFDVAHDETQPFVVETYACDVRVLGTKFNVSASESEGSFETALIRGRVEIRNRTTHETVALHPDETVMLKNDRLVRSTIADPDDYLWTDGYVNLKGHTFEELIARYRKVFDVRIELDGVRMPDTRFKWGKICVKDGVDQRHEGPSRTPIRLPIPSIRTRGRSLCAANDNKNR